MRQFKIDKKIIEQKIIASFFILTILFSSLFYVKPAYAFMDLNQLAANVYNWAVDVITAIDKVTGGVAKAALSTALVKFAQDLGNQVVNSIATGNAGQEPLYFNFSLEDTVKAAVDNAVGYYLDDYIAKNNVDLCKPIGVTEINWKFKLMLNIIPDLKYPEVQTTQYKCTVSKFVNNVKTSINNIMLSIQRSFGKECFSEFESSDICGVVHTAIASVTAFDINSLKNVYGYDSSPTFCKNATYYLKSGVSSSNFFKAAANITLNSMCGTQVSVGGISVVGGINKNLVDDNIWTTNKSECLKRSSSGVFDIDPTKIAADVFNLSDTSCLVSFNYCKFDNNGSPVFDRAKQKKFIDQYNNCYRTKVKEALGSLIEVGPALPVDKVIQQDIKNKCSEMMSYLQSNTSNEEEVDLIKRAIVSEQGNDFAFFITKKISPDVYANYTSIQSVLINSGEEQIVSSSYGDLKEDFPFLTKIVFYKPKSYTDFENQIGKSSLSYPSVNKTASSYDILYFKDATDEYFYYQDAGKLHKINLIDQDAYNKYKDIDYENIREYMESTCVSLNTMNADSYLAAEQAQDVRKMAAISATAEADKASAKDNAEKTYQLGGFKSVVSPISKQVKTPADTVENEVSKATDSGKDLLKPTGDIIIDTVMAFLTQIITGVSKNLLTQGMFNLIMPPVSEPEISDFDTNQYITNDLEEGSNVCNNTNDPSKFS
ncbi:MAG TPA: hypothetical protein PLM63_03390, partial [bacterium]|nr:hypothetical protein [bacterium]